MSQDWRDIEAAQFTLEERRNLRSWGVEVLEPKAPAPGRDPVTTRIAERFDADFFASASAGRFR